jgi:hypothetical protein
MHQGLQGSLLVLLFFKDISKEEKAEVMTEKGKLGKAEQKRGVENSKGKSGSLCLTAKQVRQVLTYREPSYQNHSVDHVSKSHAQFLHQVLL